MRTIISNAASPYVLDRMKDSTSQFIATGLSHCISPLRPSLDSVLKIFSNEIKLHLMRE